MTPPDPTPNGGGEDRHALASVRQERDEYLSELVELRAENTTLRTALAAADEKLRATETREALLRVIVGEMKVDLRHAKVETQIFADRVAEANERIAAAERAGAERALRWASPFSEHDSREDDWVREVMAALFPPPGAEVGRG